MAPWVMRRSTAQQNSAMAPWERRELQAEEEKELLVASSELQRTNSQMRAHWVA